MTPPRLHPTQRPKTLDQAYAAMGIARQMRAIENDRGNAGETRANAADLAKMYEASAADAVRAGLEVGITHAAIERIAQLIREGDAR